MVRSALERYAVGAFAFMALAAWLGIGIVDGLLCLAVSFVACHATGLYQRRSDARARDARRRERPRNRQRPVADRPARRGMYDSERDDLAWPTASDAAW